MINQKELRESARAFACWMDGQGLSDPQLQIKVFSAEVLRLQLELARGNQCRMASSMGRHRNTIARQLRTLGLPTKLPKGNQKPVAQQGK